jgi:hypothetical protein
MEVILHAISQIISKFIKRILITKIEKLSFHDSLHHLNVLFVLVNLFAIYQMKSEFSGLVDGTAMNLGH